MRFRKSLLLGLALATSLVAAPVAATSGPTGHTQIPSAVPSTISPAVNDGQVSAIVQVGNTMIIGGTFTNLTPKGGAATRARRSPLSTRPLARSLLVQPCPER